MKTKGEGKLACKTLQLEIDGLGRCYFACSSGFATLPEIFS